jgi:hypothetical protein
VTDEHFEQATQQVGSPEAAQNAAQQDAEMPCTESHVVTKSAIFDKKRGYATECEQVMGGTGLEPVTSRV